MTVTWQRRIERAQELAKESPVLPELLDFYRQIARFQSNLADGLAPANLEVLRALIRRTAPDPSAQIAWSGAAWDDSLRAADPLHAFFARVLLQANASARPRQGAAAGIPPRCPCCGEKPVAAVLRPAGGGARRFLLCALCSAEWEHGRRGCPNCGESDAQKLLIHTDQEFPHIQVEACAKCGVYLKAIDVTRDCRAVPEVDELASVTLDMWATGCGYTKLQPNLFGL